MSSLSKDPLSRLIVAVDVQRSTALMNPEKIRVRETIFHMLAQSLKRSGIDKLDRVATIDRGDGFLLLIPPVDHVPKTRLLDTLIPSLHDELARHNSQYTGQAFRMRAVVHAGEVHRHRQGWCGTDIDIACRLLDSPALKDILWRTRAPMVHIVSDYIYSSIIRHEYDGIDKGAFRIPVWVSTSDAQHRGWIHIPPECAAAWISMAS
jgi:hypothetical protein